MGAGQKIREIRKSKKHKISDVEAKAGISEGNLSRIETGKQWPKEETLKAIADALDCQVADFFMETGAETSSSRKIPLLHYAHQTETLKNVRDSYTLQQELAGYATNNPAKWISANKGIPKNVFAIEISGNAMLPEFHEKDHVIIDPDLSPGPGDYILAKSSNGELLFRKYRPRKLNAKGEMLFQLIPLNEDYPALSSDITPITIIGTMLEHRRYRRN